VIAFHKGWKHVFDPQHDTRYIDMHSLDRVVPGHIANQPDQLPRLARSARRRESDEAMNARASLLTALLLAPLAALHAKRNSPGVPIIGKLRAGSFQAVEILGAMTSKDCN